MHEDSNKNESILSFRDDETMLDSYICLKSVKLKIDIFLVIFCFVHSFCK